MNFKIEDLSEEAATYKCTDADDGKSLGQHSCSSVLWCGAEETSAMNQKQVTTRDLQAAEV